MRLSATFVLVLFALSFTTTAFAQIVPPAPGVEMPQAYFDRVAQDPTAFQFQKAWLQKFERVQEARRQIADLQRGGMDLAQVPSDLRERAVMAGTVRVPVIVIEYANVAAPYTTATLDAQLFSNPTGTLTEYYSEISDGNVILTGDVLGWVTGSQNDTQYEGPPGCNGLCGQAKTGQLILEALQGVDGAVDFGQYDNDGPDGIANSGDDDGFVDFIAIVHPETGGECGGTNMWSHRWVVQGWSQFPGPWNSNDARNGGGVIRVWDYTIQPALGETNGCQASGPNEIGVFAHEFGHAFGLPDLYDTNGGGQGIGEHGLMGSGNWQLPPNPVHMGPWSKMVLGWLNSTEVGPMLQGYNIQDVETNALVYQLNVMEEKFSRKTVDPLSGTASLHCGLPPVPANNRNWPGSKGYGNNWDESIRRDFSYDGVDPVTLEYDVAWDTEATYDFAEVWIDVNGTKTKLASYDGVGSASNVSIDLTPHLTGTGASTYDLSFRFTSDVGWSDEDGLYNCATAPMRVDNVSVTGGGEGYFSDFEQYEDGWYHDFTKNPNREYFLVENRNRTTGLYDHFANAEGLMIWHIDETVGNNTSGSTGTTNLRPPLVAVEEADGLNNLRLGQNRGDSGDAFPGTSGNTTFDNTTNPNSKSYNQFSTNVLVSSISTAAATMTADMRAGRFVPTLSSIAPSTGDNDQVVPVTDLMGTFLYHGGTFCLRQGVNEYAATEVDWIGKVKVAGTLDLNGVPGGMYDVVWKGPDGQEAVLADGFTVNAVATGIGDVPAQLADHLDQNLPNPFNPTTTIRYSIKARGSVTLRIYNAAGQRVRTLVDEVQSPRAAGFSVEWDGRSDAGQPVASGVYIYKLTAGNRFESTRKLVLLK